MNGQPTAIRLRNLTRRYQMGENTVNAVDGIDLDIHGGEFIVAAGSSGSGKSTLLHLLALLDRPTSGELYIGDQDTAGFDDNRLSRFRNRRIGMIFQQFNLIGDLSVIDNIALPLAYSGVPLKTRRRTARRFAEMMGLGHRLDHMPNELSGGQMQRVAIARALVNRPGILLADEPTGNLDSKTGREIMNLIYDLHDQGHTIVLVSHDPAAANQGTRKLLVSDGRIIEDAPGQRFGASQGRKSDPPPETGSSRDRKWIGLGDLFRIGLREGLLAHRMRTFLTMLGVIIGVFAVIAMSSFTLGSRQKQADQIRALGANLIRIVDAGLENEKLTAARTGGSSGLSRKDLGALHRGIPEIVKSAVVREIKMNAIYKGRRINPRILGVEGAYLDINNLDMSAGRYFDAHDRASSARVIVMGHKVAESLGTENPIGDVMLLGGVCYAIVGVLGEKHVEAEELEATTASDPGKDILIPLNTLIGRTTRIDLRSEIDEIRLQLTSEDLLYQAGRDIRLVLTALHQGVNDFEIYIPMELLKQKQQSQDLLRILTFCIASVSMIVGGIGIMNIMLASIRERIREIGVRRAVGASRRDILYQFLAEAVMISVTGGVFGVLAAFAGVFAICRALALPVVFSAPLIAIAAAASIAVGLLFGIYPARRAARLNPVDALRYE